MSLNIEWGNLASTIVDLAAGEKTIAPLEQDTEEGAIVSWIRENVGDWAANGIIEIGSRLVNWGVNLLRRAVSWSVSALWGYFIAQKNFVWNFNLNISDEALDAQLRAQRLALTGQLGSTLGCGFGWAAGMAGGVILDKSIGAIAASLGVPILAFDKLAMSRALKTATEEGLDEIGGLLSGLATSAILYTTRASGAWWFKNIRRLVKLTADFPAIADILPSGAKTVIDNWGAVDGDAWSLALETEEAIDNIGNDYLRVFVENFLEEADECFIEAGYVYAASVDREKQELADTREAVIGVQTVTEIVPDRDAPNEVITVSGRDHVTRGTVATVLATHQMIANRDLGQWVGQPVNEALRQQAPTSTLSIRLLYYPVATPPFTRDGLALAGGDPDAWHTSDVAIPYINPARLDWDKIKRAAGLQGRLFGRYRAYGYLGGRKIEVYGGSEADAKAWIEELAELSEAPLIGLGFTRRDRNSASVSSLSTMFDTVRLYPAYAIITSQKKEIDKSLGRPTLQGNFTSQEQRIELWPDTAPPFTSQILSELRKYHTPLEQMGIGFQTP